MTTRPTRLFLVRHGETEWNTARVFQGHLDSELTPQGIEQAVRLADRLQTEGISAVYSSDQRRALRTAEVLASRAGLTVIPVADLREIDCGDWTGRGYQEVITLWPEDHANWRDRPHLHRMPGGESVTDVQQRVVRYVRELLERHRGQTVCAVSHNTAVRVAVCDILGLSLEKLWYGPRQPNCAVNLIELKNGTPELLLIGDTTHMAGPH